jgi:hypothetical protein
MSLDHKREELSASKAGPNVMSQRNSKHRVLAFEDALKEIGEGRPFSSVFRQMKIEILGFGNVQIQLLFVIALILLTVLNETMGISFLLPSAQCDLNLSTRDKGLVSGMTFLGE